MKKAHIIVMTQVVIAQFKNNLKITLSKFGSVISFYYICSVIIKTTKVMCKTKRELVQEQLDLMDEIRAKANINIVTCGHCGCVFLHKLDELELTCFDCKKSGEPCDHPDLFYDGMELSAVFDEELPIQETTTEIDVDDVVRVAMDLGLNPSIAEINEVLKYYDSEVDNDPTATWELIVENLLYNCVAPKHI